MSVQEDNQALVRHYVDQSWNQANSSVIDEVLSPDFVQHSNSAPPGRDGVKAFFAMLHAGFSNISNIVDDTVAEGDLVMWRSAIRATHSGTFQGIPPTNKEIIWTAINIVRVENGKIVENWGEQNNFALMQQLGVIPSPG